MPPGSRLQDHLLPVAVSACRESIDFPTVTLSVARRGLPRLPGGKLDVMTGADGGAGAGAGQGWRWDVALSFDGAQRDYVGQVAEALKARGVRCFYDADEQIELWGKYLAEEVPAIYGEQAAAVVVFVSAEYAARDWTRVERRAALNRAVRERRDYVLPARFDDTPLPGLLSDMVAVDLRGQSPQQFAAMIVGKLIALGITGSTPPRDLGDSAQAGRPAGAVRAAEADPRLLGVHAAISVPGVSDEVPPEYVPRDIDNAEHGRPGQSGDRCGAGRVCAAGRRPLGREDPVRSGGSEGAAAGLVAGAPGRAEGSGRAGSAAVPAEGDLAG